MSNSSVQTDEDLIIIGDSSSSDNSLLDFNFDVSSQQSVSSEPLISFDTSETQRKTDVSFDLDFNNTVSEKNEESIDILFSGVSETKEVDDIFAINDIVEKKEEIFLPNESKEITQLDSLPVAMETSFVAPQVVESVTSLQDEIEVPEEKNSIGTKENQVMFNRNDILEEAIAKMQSRKDVISQTKSSKQSKVDQLNEQIKMLKKQVSEYESEIKELEKEDVAIDNDILSIEQMKSSILGLSDRTRVHNLDNIKKK